MSALQAGHFASLDTGSSSSSRVLLHFQQLYIVAGMNLALEEKQLDDEHHQHDIQYYLD